MYYLLGIMDCSLHKRPFSWSVFFSSLIYLCNGDRSGQECRVSADGGGSLAFSYVVATEQKERKGKKRGGGGFAVVVVEDFVFQRPFKRA